MWTSFPSYVISYFKKEVQELIFLEGYDISTRNEAEREAEETVDILSGKYRLCLLYIESPCLWVPVTTAWRFLRLRMEERPPIWRVAANKLNKHSRTADKGWSSSLGLGEALTTPLCEKQNVMKYS